MNLRELFCYLESDTCYTVIKCPRDHGHLIKLYKSTLSSCYGVAFFGLWGLFGHFRFRKAKVASVFRSPFRFGTILWRRIVWGHLCYWFAVACSSPYLTGLIWQPPKGKVGIVGGNFVTMRFAKIRGTQNRTEVGFCERESLISFSRASQCQST